MNPYFWEPPENDLYIVKNLLTLNNFGPFGTLTILINFLQYFFLSGNYLPRRLSWIYLATEFWEVVREHLGTRWGGRRWCTGFPWGRTPARSRRTSRSPRPWCPLERPRWPDHQKRIKVQKQQTQLENSWQYVLLILK